MEEVKKESEKTNYRKLVDSLPELTDKQLLKLGYLTRMQILFKNMTLDDLNLLLNHINYEQSERHLTNE